MAVKSMFLKRYNIILGFTFLLLASCATKQVNHVPGFEVIYHDPNLSHAQNVLKLVYFNRYSSDARFATTDWQNNLEQADGQYFAKQANIRSSAVSKQLRRNVNLDTTRPFDQPNIISWVEVPTLADYGTSDYRKMVHASASTYILSSLDADVESTYDEAKPSASVEFRGRLCVDVQSKLHANKIRNGEWIGSGQDVTCFINFKHEIVRPVLQEDWVPEGITLDRNKKYVVVRTRLANFEAYLYSKRLNNSYTFFPPKRTTHKRGRSITTGKSTPFMVNGDNIYLFVKPYENQEARVSANAWVTGNKLP